MKKHLQEQVARIIDEGRGASRRVIIQMAVPDGITKNVLRTVAKRSLRERLMVGARDLLPARATAFRRSRSGRITAAASQELRAHELSTASMMAQHAEQGITQAAMKRQGLALLAPLLKSEIVSNAIASTVHFKKSGAQRSTGPARYWSSSSMSVKIGKDDLNKLPTDVQGIADIFLNRALAVPTVTEVKSLPKSVLDNKTSSWGIQATGAMSVWGGYGATGKGIKVAVLDTGVNPNHPDLQGKVSDWAEFDEQGLQVPGSIARDTQGHGTHCAGTIAGGDASGRYIGMAPDAEIAAGLVLPGGSGYDAQILAGMEWAIELGVDVISMSLGGLRMAADVVDTYTRTILRANQLGITVVAAIGNEGNQTSGTPGSDYFAYAIGATDSEDNAAGFSSGRTQIITESRYIQARYLPLVYSKPEVSAPGVAVLSSTRNGKWEAWNGTSMAAPHAAGAMALLLSATDIRNLVDPVDRAFLLQDLVTSSVEELGEAGQDHRYGYGRLDVLRAVGFAWDQGYGV